MLINVGKGANEMTKQWIEIYDEKLEMWGTLLLNLQNQLVEGEKRTLWFEMLENWKTCHQWLSQLEIGQGHEDWKSEIEKGVTCLEVDWERFNA